MDDDRRVEELLAVIPDIVITLSPEGRLLACSAAIQPLLGYQPHEVIGLHLADMPTLDDEGRAIAATEMRGVLSGERVGAVLIPLVHRSGERRWFEVRSGVWEAGDGTRGIRAILRDTTERLNAEQRLRAIINSTNDIIIIFDRLGILQFENPAVELVLGYPRGEWIGRSIVDLLHPDDSGRGLQGLASLQVPDAAVCLSLRFRHKNGSYRHIEASGRNMCHEPAVAGILGVGRDVTDRIRLQERLEASERLDSIGRLAGGVAHDFNNLLSVIFATAEELRASAPNSAAVSGIELILDTAERARELTGKLLTFARRQPTEAGATVDLTAALWSVEPLLRRLLGTGCVLDVDLCRHTVIVPMAPTQFEQLVLNLAANARDAMPDGGVLRITLQVEDGDLLRASGVAVEGRGPVARLAFADTGVGMTPDVAAKALEPFYSTKAPGKGTGLGLSIVYGIIRSAGGDVRIVSEPGFGTLVELILPTTEVRAARSEDGTSDTAADLDVRGGTETVLVVEDNDDVRQLTSRTLAHVGYQVIEASSGAQALDLLARGTAIDLVITDVIMPQMNGVTMAQEIRRRFQAMPILFITGYTPEHVLERQPLDLRTALLTKPFKRDAFLQHVRTMLDVAPA